MGLTPKTLAINTAPYNAHRVATSTEKKEIQYGSARHPTEAGSAENWASFINFAPPNGPSIAAAFWPVTALKPRALVREALVREALATAALASAPLVASAAEFLPAADDAVSALAITPRGVTAADTVPKGKYGKS